MKKMWKICVGSAVLMLMFACTVTVFASTTIQGSSKDYWILGDYDVYKSTTIAPYAAMSVEISWEDDGAERFRPSGMFLVNFVNPDGIGVISRNYSVEDDMLDYGGYSSSLVKHPVTGRSYVRTYKGSYYWDGFNWEMYGAVPAAEYGEYSEDDFGYYGEPMLRLPPNVDIFLENPANIKEFDEVVWECSTYAEVDAALKANYGSKSYAMVREYELKLPQLPYYRVLDIVSSSGDISDTYYRSILYTYDVTCTLAPNILYTDGVVDEEVFLDQKIDLNNSGDYLYLHDETPQFVSSSGSSIPVRDGYEFVGWKLVTGADKDTDIPGGVRATVEESQMDDTPVVIYEAVWESVEPKLAIAKIASKSTVAPGDEVTYTIEVSNVGQGIAKSVKVKDVLDSRLEFVSYKIADGAVITSQPDGSVYQLGDIATGDSVKLYITTRVSEGAPNGEIRNTAVGSRYGVLN